jgi:hypothetical protein
MRLSNSQLFQQVVQDQDFRPNQFPKDRVVRYKSRRACRKSGCGLQDEHACVESDFAVSPQEILQRFDVYCQLSLSFER